MQDSGMSSAELTGLFWFVVLLGIGLGVAWAVVDLFWGKRP